MSNTQNLLDRYSQAVNALEDHKRANASVFSAHQQLVFRVIDAENALRDEIEVTKEAPKNEYHEVKVTPQSQTFADIEVIDQLIRDGVIPQRVRNDIVKTVSRPDYVGIRPLPQE